MVAHSGKLISAIEDALAAVTKRDRAGFNVALDGMYQAYQQINASMHTMWGHSKPADYLNFRSFIFGTGPGKRLNKMFPNGVCLSLFPLSGWHHLSLTKRKPSWFTKFSVFLLL